VTCGTEAGGSLGTPGAPAVGGRCSDVDADPATAANVCPRGTRCSTGEVVGDGELATVDDGDLASVNNDEVEDESATVLDEELSGKAEQARDEGVTRSRA
jgi:hypothetical protein